MLSELLLYHLFLGRGYISPFPVTRGIVVSSATPADALNNVFSVEALFHRFHEQAIAEDRRVLEQAENQPEALAVVTGMTKAKLKEMKEKLSRRAHTVWTEDNTLRSTIVELLKNHYYGSFTYLDATGSRLAVGLAHPSKLASDLGLRSLMEGTTDATFIRAGSTGGALIHSLAGANPIFNYYSHCKEPQLEKLIEKLRNSSQGQVGLGDTVVIRGRPGIFSGTSVDTLYSLATRVFALGDQPEAKRVKVRFAPEFEREWKQFLNWQLGDLLGDPDPPAWQVKLAQGAPTSPTVSILFAARAAMVAAFIQAARFNPDGPLKEIELDDSHLQLAKDLAQFLYRTSSNQESYEKRLKNLKDPKEVFVTPHKLDVARIALIEAIERAPARRLSRDHVNRNVQGVTLGLLDELVIMGDIVELCGVEECQMGKTVRAYTLPAFAPPGNVQDALAEYEEAVSDFAEHPEAFLDSEALLVSHRLSEKAAAVHRVHFLPVVSLSRMSKRERRMLPKVLAMFPNSFLLRGDKTEIPEPKAIAEDDDDEIPLDAGGINVWVRYRPNGENFTNWHRAKKLQLAQYWGEDDEEAPAVVPA
jgi:hypothetical protein